MHPYRHQEIALDLRNALHIEKVGGAFVPERLARAATGVDDPPPVIALTAIGAVNTEIAGFTLPVRAGTTWLIQGPSLARLHATIERLVTNLPPVYAVKYAEWLAQARASVADIPLTAHDIDAEVDAYTGDAALRPASTDSEAQA